MREISLESSGASTATSCATCQAPASGEFSQMELPLHRERDERRGSYYRNCRFVDAVRRSLVKRLPHGAAQLMAESLNQFDDLPRVVARIHDEHSAQTRWTVDVFVAGLIQLSMPGAMHVLNKIARPLGLWVIPAPASALEDSAA